MQKEWINWSGSLRFSPLLHLLPENEDETRLIVEKAINEGKKIRVAGAGHSSSALVKTEDILVSMSSQKAIFNANAKTNLAELASGLSVHEANRELLKRGLALHNTGDVDVQMLVGAIGTGTHGTGKQLQNLSSMLWGVRLINGKGEIVETSEEEDPAFMKALRVGLGTLGIFTRLTLKLVPAFRLLRHEYFTDIDSCLLHWDELSSKYRNCDFYWYPRNDLVKIRIMNPPEQGVENLPFGKLDESEEGWSADILPKKRKLKFDEMEYALPAEVGIRCFLDVRERIRKKHRKEVAWRVLYRTVKGDSNYLSPAYGRDTVTISLHHNAGLPYDAYFNDIEPIFRSYSGRPHWGKKHNLTAATLRTLYPEWDTFQHYRRLMDPENIFITPYLDELLLNY